MRDYKALVVDKKDDETEMSIQTLTMGDDLTKDEVLIDVHYSSINYKDGMVAALGQIATTYPITPGIDLAGRVVKSENDHFKVGDDVLATSYDIGTGIDGGYAELVKVPADYVHHLPAGLTLKESMILGTAGLTAAIAITKLESVGVHKEGGPVLVAGASGGSGSLSVNMLSKLGYQVVASSGSKEHTDYLTSIGANDVIDRSEVENDHDKPVNKPLYQAAIDPVGGKTTEYIIKTLKPEGALATFGLVGGVEVHTSVLPFIGRGIHWLGVDSVYYPKEKRVAAWKRLGEDLKPDILDSQAVTEVSLNELPQSLHDIIDGKTKGRTIVNLKL
ncbi:MAG TPA: acryloyl-CoA reductase [Candidatus Jeotgalicoccus stercoravium]|nr:acryloyl-CoA reductase [Candidatus Jeotgalicoccus stercoravium]